MAIIWNGLGRPNNYKYKDYNHYTKAIDPINKKARSTSSSLRKLRRRYVGRIILYQQYWEGISIPEVITGIRIVNTDTQEPQYEFIVNSNDTIKYRHFTSETFTVKELKAKALLQFNKQIKIKINETFGTGRILQISTGIES